MAGLYLNHVKVAEESGGEVTVPGTVNHESLKVGGVEVLSSSGTATNMVFPTGSFTPVFKKAGSNTDAYVNNSPVAEGFYQKMGKVVYVTGSIRNDTSFEYNTGITSSDHLAIGDLPFDASLQSSDDSFWNQGAFHIWFNNLTSWSASYNQLGLIRTTDDGIRNQIALYYYVANGTSIVQTQYYFSASSSIIFNGWYFTDD